MQWGSLLVRGKAGDSWGIAEVTSYHFGLNFQSISMVKGKEVPQETLARVEESVEDNFTTTQALSLKIDVHGSTLSFALETLARHRVLIGQLQDEVDYL